MTSRLSGKHFYWTTGLSMALAWSQSASAAMITGSMYEPFNYAAGTTFTTNSGQNGGKGWNLNGDAGPNPATSQWGDPTAGNASGIAGGSAAAKTATAPTLSYAGAIGYPIAGQGNKFNLNSTAAGPNNLGRPLGGQVIDSGTTYFSLLMQRENDTIRTMNMSFHGGSATERFAVGQIGATAGNSAGNIALLMNNSNPAGLVQAATPIAMGTGITHLIIGKIDWNAGGFETVSLWVDPANVITEVAAGPVYVSTSAFELTSISAIRPFAGNTATVAGSSVPGVIGDFDEIRLGGTWASVTTDPVLTIPEPCSLTLTFLASCVFGFSGLRRRAA